MFCVCTGHGQWSSYGSWSKCSENCVQYQERHCNSPEPAFGGNLCSGKDKKFKYCLEGDCECKMDDEFSLDISSFADIYFKIFSP